VPPAAARKSLRRRTRSKATTERALRLRTEPLAPLRATRSENPAPTFGRHPGAETVPTLAHQFARLVGAFHVLTLRDVLDFGRFIERTDQFRAPARDKRGVIREPFPLVNVTWRTDRSRRSAPTAPFRPVVPSVVFPGIDIWNICDGKETSGTPTYV
jgi:hypothetical protein